MSEMSQTRILIVDDDLLLVKSLSETLQSERYTIAAVTGGRAGINAFQGALDDRKPFAVVITDLGMHDVDGIQVASAVKNASPFTPVILLTGWGQWFEIKDGVPLQVDFILDKPPKLNELRAILARCLEKTRN